MLFKNCVIIVSNSDVQILNLSVFSETGENKEDAFFETRNRPDIWQTSVYRSDFST